MTEDQHVAHDERTGLNRRGFLAAAGAGAVAAGVAGTATRVQAAPGRRNPPRGKDVLETVTGPVAIRDITWALAHEHMHGDFTGSNPPLWTELPKGYELPDYADTDWSAATGACINAVNEVKAQGVDLIVDYSPAGVGRNVRMLREVSRRTGVHIIAASGLYRTAWGIPPELANYDADELASHFVRELTQGTEGTGVKAGFMKLSVGPNGPSPHDETVYRGAARAAAKTGAAVGIHATTVASFHSALAILDDEKLDVTRLIWAHAGTATKDFAEFQPLGERGIYISFENLTAGRTPTDEEHLELIEQFLNADLGDRIHLSTDAVITAHPPVAQYDKDMRYPYKVFKPKLEQRFGTRIVRQILRDNVVNAYRRGSKID
jgi:phosphotriesterase-related protein